MLIIGLYNMMHRKAIVANVPEDQWRARAARPSRRSTALIPFVSHCRTHCYALAVELTVEPASDVPAPASRSGVRMAASPGLGFVAAKTSAAAASTTEAIATSTSPRPGSHNHDLGEGSSTGGGAGAAPGAPPSPPEPPPLHAAAQRGDMQVLSDLLDSDQAQATDVDPQNITALHWAAINGHLLACSLLISRGAQVDAYGGELVATPLMWAARNGRVYVVHLLVSHGADPSLVDAQGFNTLHLATHSSSALTVAYLLSCCRPPAIEVDAKDPEGHTSLHWACYQGDAISLDLLLGHGASVSAVDNTGMAPLHWAVVKGNSTCIRKLVEAKANLSAQTNEGKTPRAMAEELKATAAWKRALAEAGYESDGRYRPRSLSPLHTRYAIFAVPLLGLGLIFETFALLPWYTAWPLVGGIGYGMHHLVSVTLLDARRRGGHGNTGDIITKSPYLAGIITSSLFWVGYGWLTRLAFGTPDSLLTNFVFVVSWFVCAYAYYRACTLEPGFVPKASSQKQLKEVRSFLPSCSSCV